MKKIIILLLAVSIFVAGFVASASAEVLGRKAFAISGEFIEYIPFSFTVPYGNCSNVETYEYIPSYPSIYGEPSAHWQELAPGSQVISYSVGIFKFIVDGSICSPDFVVEGQLYDMDIYGSWSGMEQNPEDLGVLVAGVGYSNNYFNLSADDYQFSYVIVFPRYGMKHTLDQLVAFAGNGNSGIQPSGSDLVGAIISDKKGFLSQIIFNPLNLDRSARKLKEKSKGIIINDDQIVVLIYKENY